MFIPESFYSFPWYIENCLRSPFGILNPWHRISRTFCTLTISSIINDSSSQIISMPWDNFHSLFFCSCVCLKCFQFLYFSYIKNDILHFAQFLYSFRSAWSASSSSHFLCMLHYFYGQHFYLDKSLKRFCNAFERHLMTR